jgi:DnaJ homolog subfamily C member 19
VIGKLLVLAAIGLGLYLFVTNKLAGPRGMSVDEAAKLLGVGVQTDTNSIIEAHRRLITKVHPDAGGTDALAAQINRARDIMLKHIQR